MAIGAVLYAKNLNHLIDFYQRLNLELVEKEDGDYAVLESIDAPGAVLTLVQAPAQIADSIEISTPPVVRSSNPIKLTLLVGSIDALLGGIDEHGGISNTAIKRWKFRNHDHHDIVDPEGNVIQLKQSI